MKSMAFTFRFSDCDLSSAGIEYNLYRAADKLIDTVDIRKYASAMASALANGEAQNDDVLHFSINMFSTYREAVKEFWSNSNYAVFAVSNDDYEVEWNDGAVDDEFIIRKSGKYCNRFAADCAALVIFDEDTGKYKTSMVSLARYVPKYVQFEHMIVPFGTKKY